MQNILLQPTPQTFSSGHRIFLTKLYGAGLILMISLVVTSPKGAIVKLVNQSNAPFLVFIHFRCTAGIFCFIKHIDRNTMYISKIDDNRQDSNDETGLDTDQLFLRSKFLDSNLQAGGIIRNVSILTNL